MQCNAMVQDIYVSVGRRWRVRCAGWYLVSHIQVDALKQAPVGDTMRLCPLLSAALAVTVVAADSRRVVQPAPGGKNSWKPHKPLHIASELKSPKQQRGARNTNFANQNSYGGPPEASEPVDLHNKEFCVDVSTYQPVVWVEREAESCETVFVKQCSDRSENVCQDVTETKCEVRITVSSRLDKNLTFPDFSDII